MSGPGTSLRSRILLIIAGVGLPLALVGAGILYSAQDAGESILRARLDTALTRAAEEMGMRWVHRRSVLLSIGDDSAVARTLTGKPAAGAIPLRAAGPDFAELRQAAQLVLVRDRDGIARWVLEVSGDGHMRLLPAADSLRLAGPPSDEVIPVRLPIYAGSTGAVIGAVEARLWTAGLVPAIGGSVAGAGGTFAVIDRATGASIAPLPFDPALLRRERFTWGGEEWIAASRLLDEPAIELLAASPAGAYTLPFQRALRNGLIALLLAGGLTGLIAIVLTRRVTRSLETLAVAADAVSHGDLEHRVDVSGANEVHRVAGAFNQMLESLRRTLAQLSEQQAIAALGEFAAALAHEIRNPLSAIRLRLQHVEEQLAQDATLHESLRLALHDVNRLDQTVGGVLRLARTGKMRLEPTSLRGPFEAAFRAALPEAEQRGASLAPIPPECDEARVQGNPAALEQLFVNLMLNAAQAVDDGGRAGVSIDRTNPEIVAVTVWDTGAGADEATVARAFDPFFSTKPEGTGLGLTVAQRIAAAHGATITFASTPGQATRVRVEFPALTSHGPVPAE